MSFPLAGLIQQGVSAITDNSFMEEDRNQQQEWVRGMHHADKQWMEHMSNTAYQRGTKDMMKAGLNPMLAYHQGGASAPSVGTPSSPGGKAPGLTGASGYISSAVQAQRVESEVRLNEANAEKAAAEAEEIRGARVPERHANTERLQQDVRESVERINKLRQEVLTGRASAAQMEQQVTNMREEIPRLRAQTDQLRALAKLNDAQAIAQLASAGVSREQAKEIRQRVQQNLPQMERALMDLERIAQQMAQPGHMANEAAQSSFIGHLGAYLRALLPIGGLVGAIPFSRSKTIIHNPPPINIRQHAR